MISIMIALESRDLELLKQILAKYPYRFYAYGSRVKNTHKKFSDLDLCIMEDIDPTSLEEIKLELEDSDITIKIDLKSWQQGMNDDFRSLIKNDLVAFKMD